MNNIRQRLKAERELLVQARGALIETVQGWSEQRQRDNVRVDPVRPVRRILHPGADLSTPARRDHRRAGATVCRRGLREPDVPVPEQWLLPFCR